ncbi:hypothetical protein F4804DRAFT_333461 [Jackrogersella minutella]|nr:hypothetical protein F4804DRAFT_333461 [Jackrogersella minutella]
MNYSLAARWVGQVKPRLLTGSRALRLRPHPTATQRRASPGAAYFHHSRRQYSDHPNPQQFQRKPITWQTIALFNLVGVSAVIITAVTLRGGGGEDQNGVINKSTFSPFTIVSKEQVSPTAFILTVRAGDPDSSSSGKSTRVLREAWAHGLWSVEVKQPQLQISRHYTPLPPRSDDEAELRFLIRRLDGGEMSTYLSKLREGEAVHLRGPHLGFDVARRLGDAEDVVFLAGGTGVAPALQAARRLLQDGRQTEKPRVAVLWANRRAADALGRPRQEGAVPRAGKGWLRSGLWSSAEPSATAGEGGAEECSLARQICAMREAFPGHFQLSYFVDEERFFVTAEDLDPFVCPPAKALLAPATSCAWHSPTTLDRLPNDDDGARRRYACTCVRAAKGSEPTRLVGANLACVSGPDGFVAAYAGPKRWYGGGEMQGPVAGVLGEVLAAREDRGNWLVLKL